MTVRRRWKYLAGGAAVAVLLGILAALAFTNGEQEVLEEESSGTVQSADLVWQGKEYNYREHLSNFQFAEIYF